MAGDQPGDNNGTSVRTAGDVLRRAGHVSWQTTTPTMTTPSATTTAPEPAGILHFRWARSVDEVHQVLGNERADESAPCRS